MENPCLLLISLTAEESAFFVALCTLFLQQRPTEDKKNPYGDLCIDSLANQTQLIFNREKREKEKEKEKNKRYHRN